MSSKETPVITSEHEKYYSDSNFWDKIKTVAKKAGEELINNALLLYYTLQSPTTPVVQKTLIIGALGYFILPVDLISDFIPVLGFTDDTAALIAIIKNISSNITQEIKQKARDKSNEILDNNRQIQKEQKQEEQKKQELQEQKEDQGRQEQQEQLGQLLQFLQLQKQKEKKEKELQLQKKEEQMEQEQIRISINDFANDFNIYANNYDILSYNQITEVNRKKICNEHQLPIETTIYYFREYSEAITFVISDLGLSRMCINSETFKFESELLHWMFIENVEYDSQDDVFYIYMTKINQPIMINRYQLIKSCGQREQFALILREIASLKENKENNLFKLIDNENFDEIINIGEKWIQLGLLNIVDFPMYYVLAKSYYCKAIEEQEENSELKNKYLGKALQYVEKSLNINDQDEDSIFHKAEIYYEMENYTAARKLYIDLMCSKNKDLARESVIGYNQVTNSFINTPDKNFTNIIDLSHRKFIMFVKDNNTIAGCNDCENNIEFVFTLDAYPKDLIFPVGHPQANTLYMVHPMLHTHYLLYENIKETLFLDKVRDFCYLAQCLGATRIKFKAIKGEAVSIDSENDTDISANVGRKLVNLEGSVKDSSKEHYSNTKTAGQEWEYTFNPLNKPYCPEDSIWLESDKSWQQMVKMRLQGNQITFTERISSKETLNITSKQQSAVEASFSTLLWKVSGKKGEQTEEVIFKSEESEYEINVTFKPLCEYKEITTNVINEPANKIEKNNEEALTANEEKYKEEVLFYLEDDDQITPDERIMLERKRIKFNISEDRVLAIENMCRPTLSESEKEYIDIYKELCADGEITERKRKMLNREREELGIYEERAKELESKL